ncbi:MAG: hypothetical protein M0P64_02510 [Candidatus Pacebacteria bacterium]|jgi:hypothetical protein|nr:hypothetical protein [Candidatus Paceibacterota bacterium]
MISIVTSLYKSETHLPAFLKSAQKVHHGLAKQNIQFEHILVANDFSNQERMLVGNSGLNFKIITVPRETLYASWNRGTKESLYEYITFWAVDDLRFTKAFIEGSANLSKGFQATYFPYIYKRYIYVWGIKILAMIKVVDPAEYDRELFKVGMYAGPHFMFTKETFSIVGEFNESFKISGDFDWWSRAAQKNVRIIKTKTLSGVFNNDGKTLSGSKNDLQKKENDTIIRNVQ